MIAVGSGGALRLLGQRFPLVGLSEKKRSPSLWRRTIDFCYLGPYDSSPSMNRSSMLFITRSWLASFLAPTLLAAPVSITNFSFEADRNNTDAVGAAFSSGQLDQITTAELTAWTTLNPALNSDTIAVGSRNITPAHGNGSAPPASLGPQKHCGRRRALSAHSTGLEFLERR